MLYELLIFFLNAVGVLVVLGWIIQRKADSGLSSLRFWLHRRTLTYVFSVLGLFSVSFFVVNVLIQDPSLDSAEQKIEHYSKLDDFHELAWAYVELLDFEDTTEAGLDLHFSLIHNTRRAVAKDRITHGADSTSHELIGIIERLYRCELESDDARLFYGMHQVDLGALDSAYYHLSQVTNKDLKYYNYAWGRFYKRMGFLDSATVYFQKSIDANLFPEGSYRELSTYLFDEGENLALRDLALKDEDGMIHTYIRRLSFYYQANFLDYMLEVFRMDIKRLNLWGTLAAFLISLIWIIYIWKLDVYEPERWSYVGLTFLLSAITIHFVFPITDTLNFAGFELNGSPLNDLLYCIVGIGMVEEMVKILPVLFMVYFTKEVDEPYDFILYGSVSALGFAFVENIGYIEQDKLNNIGARGFLAAVGHMMWTSTICYGMLLNRYKWHQHRWLTFFGFFLLAAIAHGFYDFWLINDWASSYNFLTLIFFLMSVHIWFLMKNNAINISTFFDPKIVIRNDQLKFFLIISFLSLFLYGYIAQSIYLGAFHANDYLMVNLAFYGYFIIYLAFIFSRFDIVHGYFAPINIPFNVAFPRLIKTAEYSGKRIELQLIPGHKHDELLEEAKKVFPPSAYMRKRKVVDGDKHWYVLELEKQVQWSRGIPNTLLMFQDDLDFDYQVGEEVQVFLAAIPRKEMLNQTFLHRRQLVEIGWATAVVLADE